MNDINHNGINVVLNYRHVLHGIVKYLLEFCKHQLEATTH